MNKYTLIVLLAICIIVPQKTLAQNELGTKVVDIVKSYTPSIAEAYKKRQEASLKDSLTLAKQNITYSIYSVPVASTFIPEKGKANTLEKKQKNTFNNSYVALGLGNNTTLYGDASLSKPIGKNANLGFLLEHLSSAGNIKNVIPKDNFSKTKTNLRYDFLNKKMNWGLVANLDYRTNNWYGINKEKYTATQMEAIKNIAQSYLDYGFDGYFNLHESVFKGIDLKFNALSDKYNTAETHFRATPSAEMLVGNEKNAIHANFLFDYLNTKFKQSFNATTPIENQWTLLGINPTYHFSTNGFDLKLGGMLVYASATNNHPNSGVKIFPDMEASYRLFDQYATLKAGLKGTIQQNTFSELTKVNPFLSPTLTLQPTEIPFDVFASMSGKIFTTLLYKLKANYRHYKTMPLFTTNASLSVASPLGYQYDNSFTVLYDKVNEIAFTATLGGNIERIFYFDLETKLASYSTDTQQEAWNLPSVQLSLFTDVKLTEALSAGTNLYYIGSRKDKNYALSAPFTVLTNDSFLDLNLHTNYALSEKWQLFARVNNLLSNNYNRWLYYPVQGLQVLIGASYQFKL